MAWEIDNTKERTGFVWARKTDARVKKWREWHWCQYGNLRKHSDKVPVFNAAGWEIEWGNRNGKLVWARNIASIHRSARDWHWVDFHTLNRQGIKWVPKTHHDGRHIDCSGYVRLTYKAMMESDRELCNSHKLWRGKTSKTVTEHRLVAVKKYGAIPHGYVVRHLNGIKSDNRPENLVIGTTQENTADHNKARLASMFWHRKYIEACNRLSIAPDEIPEL